MTQRVLAFLLFQCGGAAVGFVLVPDAGSAALGLPLLGCVLGGCVWFALDSWRALRVLGWLRAGAAAELPLSHGWWSELADRVRRLLRAQQSHIREGEQRLQAFLAAFQASPNGVVLLDAGGQIQWFNARAAEHFGFEEKRDLLQYFGNLVRDPGFANYFAKGDFREELVMPGRQISLARPVKLSVSLHAYGQGRLLLLSRDVTALEQVEAIRRDFVANVSHEIRTPLTVLAGFIETLQLLPAHNPEHTRYLSLMAQQADRMQTLVSDLLVLSRLEGHLLPGAEQWCAMGDFMNQLEQEAHALSSVLVSAFDPPHQLFFDPPLAVQLLGARHELQSAMSNLLGNALRYTPPGGCIWVGVRLLADDRLVFSVRDTGPGIAPEHIPRLTERFYRVDPSRSRDTGGTGLGLAIVKHVAQRHGATLEIDSTPGKGATFKLVFPASRVQMLTHEHSLATIALA